MAGPGEAGLGPLVNSIQGHHADPNTLYWPHAPPPRAPDPLSRSVNVSRRRTRSHRTALYPLDVTTSITRPWDLSHDQSGVK